MSTIQNQMVAKKQIKPVETLKAMLNAESIKEQFYNSLHENQDAFISGIIELFTSDTALQRCDPKLIVVECLKAATLRLPLNRALGFSYIVVYNTTQKAPDGALRRVPIPNFIIGYKGLIQLALRTNQYKYINAGVVHEGELRAANKLTGEYDFGGSRKSDKAVGYFAYIELLNGFRKTEYITVRDMAVYAKRFSPSIRKETSVDQLVELANPPLTSRNKVGWEGDFTSMALKTVLRKVLKFGILSVDIGKAVEYDTPQESIRLAQEEPPTVDPDTITYEKDSAPDKKNDSGEEPDY